VPRSATPISGGLASLPRGAYLCKGWLIHVGRYKIIDVILYVARETNSKAGLNSDGTSLLPLTTALLQSHVRVQTFSRVTSVSTYVTLFHKCLSILYLHSQLHISCQWQCHCAFQAPLQFNLTLSIL